MGIITTLSSAVIGYCAAQLGGTVGSAICNIGTAILKYVWLEADSGYFKDFPEDENREHTLQNIMFRISVIMHESYVLKTIEQNYNNSHETEK